MGLPEFTVALAQEMRCAGVNQSELGRLAKVAPSMINAWVQGNTAKPDLDKVRDVEDALRLPAGHLTRHLGWLPTDTEAPTADVLAVIEADPRVTDGQKDALRLLYNLFRRQTADA